MFVAWVLLCRPSAWRSPPRRRCRRPRASATPGGPPSCSRGYAVSICLLTIVIREIPVSIAYAVWAGLGTAGIAVVGVVLLGERARRVQGRRDRG